MQKTAAQLADLLGGRVLGDSSKTVNQLAKIETAQRGDLSFLANIKYLRFLEETNASVVLISESLVPKKTIENTISLVVVKDAYSSMAILMDYINKDKVQPKTEIESPNFIHSSIELPTKCYIGAFAYLSESVLIGANVQIYPNCFIGENVSIGENSILYPGVKIYNDCKIGANCIIHSGTVIGSDGFGFVPDEEGKFKKIPQLGNVLIEDNVEIGANCCLDRATLGSTIIKEGVKLDNLVQVAHNVEIGSDTVIAAQAGIAGSTKLGDACFIGGQVGFSGHLTIANGTKIQAQSGISKSVKKSGTSLNGTPAFEYRDCLRSQVLFRKLPQMEERLKSLEKSK